MFEALILVIGAVLFLGAFRALVSGGGEPIKDDGHLTIPPPN